MYTPLAQRFSKSLNSMGNQQIVDPLGISGSYQYSFSMGRSPYPMRTHRVNPRGYEDSSAVPPSRTRLGIAHLRR